MEKLKLDKLKPCPFCGGEANLYSAGLTITKIYAVACMKCKVQYPPIFADEDMAIEAWNKRTETHEERTETNIFDKETRIKNCTVQILENTETGKISIGWWKNEN